MNFAPSRLMCFAILSLAGCSNEAPMEEASDDAPWTLDESQLATDAIENVPPDSQPAETVATKAARYNDSQGGCAECEAGEIKIVAEQQVPHGQYTYTSQPTCANSTPSVQDLSNAADGAASIYSGNYAGALQSFLETSQVQEFLSNNVHGSLGRLLNNGNPATAACQQVCVIAPVSANITGYKVEAANEDKAFRACSAGSDCSIGWSKWLNEPMSQTSTNNKMICSQFANWAHQGHRWARLTVYAKPDDDWIPPRD